MPGKLMLDAHFIGIKCSLQLKWWLMLWLGPQLMVLTLQSAGLLLGSCQSGAADSGED